MSPFDPGYKPKLKPDRKTGSPSRGTTGFDRYPVVNLSGPRRGSPAAKAAQGSPRKGLGGDK
jgi:hypothetical protein